MSHPWSTWSQLVTCHPAQVEAPWTHAALERVVLAAIEQSRRIKAIGSGHSFTDIAVAQDLQLDLTNYSGVERLDQERQQVTLRSGTKLWQLPKLLADSGLAMENLGDINQQSIAGAISTSTHGTGVAFGGLGSQVVGLELLTGRGETLNVSTTQHPELLDALRVTLGAFGVITAVTLQLVPEYDLHTIESAACLDSIMRNWDALNTANDHFEFFWFGHDDYAITKTSNRVESTPRNSTVAQRIKDQLVSELISNVGLSAVCQIGRRKPNWVPKLNRLSTRAWGSAQRLQHWSTAFNSPRRVRFNEMEYAVPYDDIPEIVAELRQVFRRADISSTFPLEIRATAPDTAWLASSHGRKTGYIAVHQHIGQDHRRYFGRIEPILKAAGGRPHWGKLHTLTATDLAELYPRWASVLELRDHLDPNRLFTNPYLDRVLGC